MKHKILNCEKNVKRTRLGIFPVILHSRRAIFVPPCTKHACAKIVCLSNAKSLGNLPKRQIKSERETMTMQFACRLLCRRRKILLYAQRDHIKSGPIILTSTGRPIDRTNMWRYMNRLCLAAGIDPEKGHPHALRHLFAVVHYRSYKDPIGLADLLGHSNINTTRIYTATDGKDQIKQLNEMNLVP